MEIVMAAAIGVLTACGVWLLLRRVQELGVRGIWLMLEAFKDDLPELIVGHGVLGRLLARVWSELNLDEVFAQLQRLPETLHRLVETLQLQQSHAAVIPGLRVTWIQLNRALRTSDRFGITPQIHIYRTQIRVIVS